MIAGRAMPEVVKAETSLSMSERLASNPPICQAAIMSKRRGPVAGGIFLFLCPVAGAVYGTYRGEPILWMLYGFAAGVLLALLVAFNDRGRG